MSEYDETQELRNEHQTLSSGVIQRLKQLPIRTRIGLLRGFDKAVAVAEAHSGSHGQSWLEKRQEVHDSHAFAHLAYHETNDIDDDGLPHLDHAACRLLFAIAKREGM